MAEEETPFTWKGRDGLIYELSTCEDRHLRFFHRMIRERISEYETGLSGNNLTQKGLSRLAEMKSDNERVSLEMMARDLSPLPVRTPQEIAQAKERQRLKEQELNAFLSQPNIQQAQLTQPVGVVSQVLSDNMAIVSSGSSTTPYNPKHKQFAHGKVSPVEDRTPVIETETPRHIRLPKKKKEIS